MEDVLQRNVARQRGHRAWKADRRDRGVLIKRIQSPHPDRVLKHKRIREAEAFEGRRNEDRRLADARAPEKGAMGAVDIGAPLQGDEGSQRSQIIGGNPRLDANLGTGGKTNRGNRRVRLGEGTAHHHGRL